MGFPFLFWGGGGSDHNASTPSAGETGGSAGLPTGAVGGAAGAAAAGAGQSYPQADDDAAIYGQQQSPPRPASEPPRQSQWNEDVADEEWAQDVDEEPVMQDPWEQLFGGDQQSGSGDDWGGDGEW